LQSVKLFTLYTFMNVVLKSIIEYYV